MRDNDAPSFDNAAARQEIPGALATPRSLLERLRSRPDSASWKRLVELYQPMLRRWSRQFAVPEADAEDLVQEVLKILVREIPQFQHQGRPGAFRNWLRTILVHRVRGFWRSRQAHPQSASDPDLARQLDELVDPASNLSRTWDQEHDDYVARRLLELVEPDFTPSTWQAFRRLVMDGVKPTQVAAELGITSNAALLAKSRVLRRLRQEIQGLID